MRWRILNTEAEKSEQTVFACSDFSVSVFSLFLPYVLSAFQGLDQAKLLSLSIPKKTNIMQNTLNICFCLFSIFQNITGNTVGSLTRGSCGKIQTVQTRRAFPYLIDSKSVLYGGHYAST